MERAECLNCDNISVFLSQSQRNGFPDSLAASGNALLGDASHPARLSLLSFIEYDR